MCPSSREAKRKGTRTTTDPPASSRKAKRKGRRPTTDPSASSAVLGNCVNSRLLNYLESNQLISKIQTGYRRNRNTEDQLVLLAQEIENAFQEKKKVLTVFVDLSKAFDKVWKKGLFLKLATCGINGNMLYLIHNFLSQRTARVKLEGKSSHQRRRSTGRSYLTNTHQRYHERCPRTHIKSTSCR